MTMAWIIVVWFALNIIGVQARVGQKPSGVPLTQGGANALTVIYLCIITGAVVTWL